MNSPISEETVVFPGARQPLERRKEPLRQGVRNCLDRYLADLNGHEPRDIYRLVLAQVEPAMLETVLMHAGGNQTLAAEMLGISRSTLRKKLKLYRIEI